MEKKIYLDDIRTPISDNWIVIRNYQDFVSFIETTGLDKIEIISLDHDLGDTAMKQYYENVKPNYTLDYNMIEEKTGYDVAKFLVNYFYEKNPDRIEMDRFDKKKNKFTFPTICVHSANPIGSANIMGYINNFLMNEGQPQNCVRVQIPHT
jgi:predicted ATP-grasp superfamily ATP-dependent carboligase